MRTLFIILMGITLAFFPIGVKKLLFRKDSLSKRMLFVLIPASFALISHCVLLFVSNEIAAYVLFSFYFAFSNWIAVAVFSFCTCYTNSEFNSKILKFLIIPVSIIDTLALIANTFSHFFFSLHKIVYGSFEFFRYSFSDLLTVHFVLSYGLYIYCFIIILKKFLKEPFPGRNDLSVVVGHDCRNILIIFLLLSMLFVLSALIMFSTRLFRTS